MGDAFGGLLASRHEDPERRHAAGQRHEHVGVISSYRGLFLSGLVPTTQLPTARSEHILRAMPWWDSEGRWWLVVITLLFGLFLSIQIFGLLPSGTVPRQRDSSARSGSVPDF
jgi:hypothetical protein